MLGVLGRLWLAGAQPDWTAFGGGEPRRRVALPTYAWDHQRHWIEPGHAALRGGRSAIRSRAAATTSATGSTRPSGGARRCRAAAPDAGGAERVLVLGGRARRSASASCAALRARGHTRAARDEGAAFAARGDGRLRAARRRGRTTTTRCSRRSRARAAPPARIVHLWNLGEAPPLARASYDRTQELGFYSLLSLAQAIGRQDLSAPLRLDVVSNGMQRWRARPSRRRCARCCSGPAA